MYRIEVAPGAERDLHKLAGRISARDFENLRRAIGGLAPDPRPSGVRKIKGAQRSYRIRVGTYRVVYNVYDDQDLVLVLHVGRRNEATYRDY